MNARPTALLSPLWWHLNQGASPHGLFVCNPSFPGRYSCTNKKLVSDMYYPWSLHGFYYLGMCCYMRLAAKEVVFCSVVCEDKRQLVTGHLVEQGSSDLPVYFFRGNNTEKRCRKWTSTTLCKGALVAVSLGLCVTILLVLDPESLSSGVQDAIDWGAQRECLEYNVLWQWVAISVTSY